MDLEELEPQKKKPSVKNLEPLSIEELQAYIIELKAEIVRTEAVIAAKSSHLAAASRLFDKK